LDLKLELLILFLELLGSRHRIIRKIRVRADLEEVGRCSQVLVTQTTEVGLRDDLEPPSTSHLFPFIPDRQGIWPWLRWGWGDWGRVLGD
jgi:hypothetical protein